MFTGAYLRLDTLERKETNKERRATNVLTLAERHRVLWAEARQRPELIRIFSREADLSAQPVTIMEEEFLRAVFVHYEVGWYVAPGISPNEVKAQQEDIRDFFPRPVPWAVWQKTSQLHSPAFIRFVERALERHGRFRADG